MCEAPIPAVTSSAASRSASPRFAIASSGEETSASKERPREGGAEVMLGEDASGHVGVDGGGVEERDLDEVVAGLRGARARGAALGLGPTAGPDERVDTERVREGGRRGDALGRRRGGGREGARRSEGETTTRGRTRRPGETAGDRGGRERRGHHLSEPDEGRGGGGGERSCLERDATEDARRARSVA